MSLLTIAQNVADDLSLPQPATIIGNTEATAVRLLASSRRAAKHLARMPWRALVKEHTFSTVASTASYDLPSDYQHMKVGTPWDRSNYWEIHGPVTSAEWQQFKSGIVTTSQTRKRFQLRPESGVRKFTIDPTPTAVESLVFEYVSDAWASGSSITSEWVADSDTALIDEYLIELETKWRTLEAFGMDFINAKMEAVRETDRAFANDIGMSVLHTDKEPIVDVVNLPEAGFG